MNVRELARAAYETYCQSASGIRLQSNRRMKTWDELNVNSRARWEAAVERVASLMRADHISKEPSHPC